jgi:CRISPR-associated protein Cas8a1/Csx13
MVNEETFYSEWQKKYVQVCHEAIRRYMGKKFGRRGGANWDTEYGKIRIRFSRCKNAPSLRETVIDLWSRAGSIPELQKHWTEMLTLFSDENWRKAKDLTLLALASYQPANKADEDGNDGLPNAETEGDDNE